MVRKLRVLSLACGVAVSVLAGWAMVNYRSPIRFAPYLVGGVLVASSPWLAAHGKLSARRLRYRYRRLVGHPSTGTVFVSERSVADPTATLDALRQSDTLAEAFSGVEYADPDAKRELRISHTSFHASYVRCTDDGQLVITGPASEKNREVATRVEEVCGIEMRGSNDNPLWEPLPVRGASRLVLAACVVVATVLCTMGVAGVAYPSGAYNPVEKSVLLSFDARGDVDPRLSETEAGLRKASFMVDILAEKRTEMRWELNDTRAIRQHRREAKVICNQTRALLSRIRERTSDPGALARADRIEARLTRVERRVERTARKELAEARNATGPRTIQGPFGSGGGPSNASRELGAAPSSNAEIGSALPVHSEDRSRS
ncbi:MAG: hypothetical protein ABEI80_05890 [Haloplanus sp.]